MTDEDDTVGAFGAGVLVCGVCFLMILMVVTIAGALMSCGEPTGRRTKRKCADHEEILEVIPVDRGGDNADYRYEYVCG